MFRRFLPTLFPLAFALAGCGGDIGHGCTADIVIEGRAPFAGRYTATLSRTPTTPIARTYRLLVDAQGTATGSFTEAGSTATTAVEGRAGVLRNSCTLEGASLRIAPMGGLADMLDATKGNRTSLVGTYPATLATETGPVAYTLVVTRDAS